MAGERWQATLPVVSYGWRVVVAVAVQVEPAVTGTGCYVDDGRWQRGGGAR